jgi:hypothetical protein
VTKAHDPSVGLHAVGELLRLGSPPRLLYGVQRPVEQPANRFRAAETRLALVGDPGIEATKRFIMKAHVEGRSHTCSSWAPSSFCGASN